MKILTYVCALILSAFVYILFATYLSVSAGLGSIFPLISFYCALLVFGFLSWFHFYMPRVGTMLLIVGVVVMFMSWPAWLIVDYFDGDYRPGLIEFAVPFLFSSLTIFFSWKARNLGSLSKYVKLSLSIPPMLLTLYFGGYSTLRFFF